MAMKQIIAKLRATCRRFAGANEGNTLVTFALAFIPLVGLTGAAVDYSRAYSVQTAMQAAADTTALMIAQGAPSKTATDLQSQAVSFYNALFKRPEASNLVVTATYTSTSGATVAVNSTARYKTSFMGVMGFSSIPLAANSTATFGNSRLRVALVLDNTGSMASAGKITALKTALHNSQGTGLLDLLQGAAVNNGDVYVSIVPFVKDVNVGSGNNAATWIYWDDAAQQDNTSWNAQNGTCSDNNYSDRQSCLSGSGNCSISGNNSMSSCQAASAGSCNNSNYTSQSQCLAGGYCSLSTHHSQSGCTSHSGTWHTPAVWTVSNGVWTSNNTWTAKSHTRWNGCVMDRGDPGAPNTGNYDTNAVAPTTTNTATQYAAEQYSACPQAVMGLTYDWSGMITEITNMSPNGSTNQNIGLQLGWMSLVGGGPFTVPAMDPNYKYQQVIILLTDGLNTQDRWYGDGVNTATQVDARQALTCANVKAAGITLYTIQVNTDGSPTSTLLQNCASGTDKFFLLTSANQIVTTFNAIGTNLSRLRIAK
jgi:Flp pilus assembly protein TadG